MEPAATVWNVRPPSCASLDHWATITDDCIWWQDRNDVSDSRFCSSVVRFETQNSLRSSIGERVRPTKPEFELIDTATFDLKLTGFDLLEFLCVLTVGSHGPSVLPFISCVWHDGVIEDIGNFGLAGLLHLVYVQDRKNGLYSFGIPFVPVHSGWVLAGQGFLAVTASEAFDFDGLDAVEVSVSALVGATAFSGAEFLAVWAWCAYAGLGGGLGHRKRRLPPALFGSTNF